LHEGGFSADDVVRFLGTDRKNSGGSEYCKNQDLIDSFLVLHDKSACKVCPPVDTFSNALISDAGAMDSVA
jgi:hypothetical protein